MPFPVMTGTAGKSLQLLIWSLPGFLAACLVPAVGATLASPSPSPCPLVVHSLLQGSQLRNPLVVRFCSRVGTVPGDQFWPARWGPGRDLAWGVTTPGLPFQSHPHCCVDAISLGFLGASSSCERHILTPDCDLEGERGPDRYLKKQCALHPFSNSR